MTVLNWQNDPIYFDDVSKEVNHWINANELMENNRQEEIFLPNTETLNLFPILVRRADFLRENSSDRILARLPFIQLTEKEKVLFKNQELLVSEKLRDYFYQSDNRKILEWRDILRNYLERGAIPLPFFRCYPDEWGFDFQDRILESSRGETFGMPTTLTNELAYLCGMVNGDGNLTKYVLNIIDYSIENIKQLKEMFERLFRQTGRIQMQTENSPALIITNLWVVRLFSFLTDQPIGGKKYHKLREPLLLQQQPFRSHYWSGVMDADGSYANGSVTFTSASQEYALDFINFLNIINIKATLRNRKDNTFRVYIPRKYNEYYKQNLFSVHPEKRKQFHDLKEGNERKAKNAMYFQGFNSNYISNGLFDFSKLDGIQIIGLENYIRESRAEKTQTGYAKDLKISSIHLHNLETSKSAISIPVLLRILDIEKIQIMPLLFRYGRDLSYRRLSASPVYLDLMPNDKLIQYTRKMIFYNKYIRIDSKKKELVDKIGNHFGISIKDNLITNGTIRYFFKMICKIE